ncbi:hypothetical protein ACFQZS_01465 [Mucilaginibacter calamicampi]|uniref:GLPGLI family protein n=1 Tax=Mucilaginibacter calamicampi TaxID=1302352 RepID=A0ABW2YW58_9SPHI
MKKLQLLLFSALAYVSAYAQKLPNKQEASIRIPATVKIDGKAAEWDNKLKAYNTATDFSYTLANNNEDLYLVIQTKDRFVFNKIIDRGLTLSVKNTKTGKTANITYPHTTYTGKNERVSSGFGFGMIIAEQKVPEDEIAGYNKMLKARHKFIKVDGVEGLDSLVSVYNENGINAAEQFDNDKVYTLEMAVKLKLLGLSANDGTKFSYKLRVNTVPGAPLLGPDTKMVMMGGGEITPEIRQQAMFDMNEKVVKMYGGTEFDGEYTLAK